MGSSLDASAMRPSLFERPTPLSMTDAWVSAIVLEEGVASRGEWLGWHVQRLDHPEHSSRVAADARSSPDRRARSSDHIHPWGDRAKPRHRDSLGEQRLALRLLLTRTDDSRRLSWRICGPASR